MDVIILNNDLENPIEITNYGRNISFDNNDITSTGYFNGQDVASKVTKYGNSPITSIIIKHQGEVYYNLTNINAYITNVSEYADNGIVNLTVNLTF